MTRQTGRRLELGMVLWLWIAIAPVRGADLVDFQTTH
jgi:hypothetical protein